MNLHLHRKNQVHLTLCCPYVTLPHAHEVTKIPHSFEVSKEGAQNYSHFERAGCGEKVPQDGFHIEVTMR